MAEGQETRIAEEVGHDAPSASEEGTGNPHIYPSSPHMVSRSG